MVYDLAAKTAVDATKGLDQTAHGATWLPDGSALAEQRQAPEHNHLGLGITAG